MFSLAAADTRLLLPTCPTAPCPAPCCHSADEPCNHFLPPWPLLHPAQHVPALTSRPLTHIGTHSQPPFMSSHMHLHTLFMIAAPWMLQTRMAINMCTPCHISDCLLLPECQPNCSAYTPLFTGRTCRARPFLCLHCPQAFFLRSQRTPDSLPTQHMPRIDSRGISLYSCCCCCCSCITSAWCWMTSSKT